MTKRSARRLRIAAEAMYLEHKGVYTRGYCYLALLPKFDREGLWQRFQSILLSCIVKSKS